MLKLTVKCYPRKFGKNKQTTEGKQLTCFIAGLVHFILGGGVQVQTDWSILGRNKVKGCPIGGGHSL